MKKIVKCYRCGKEIELNPKDLSFSLICPHCKGKMTLDKKSYKRLRIVRYFVVLLVCCFLMFGLSYTKTNLAISIITISISIGMALIADRLCLVLEYLIFGLNYVEAKK